MIDPGGIPTIPGDMEALAGHAAALRGVAHAFATTGQRINATWQQLGGVYHAPEIGQLLAATAPVQTISASVGEDIGILAGALTSYADEVRQIQAQLTSLRAQASEFVALVAGDEHWRGDGDKVDHNNHLIRAVDAQLAAFFDAQRRCANAINALYGGPQYRAEDGDGQRREGEYGYTAKELDAAAAQDKVLPWGHTEEQDRGVLGDIEVFFGGVKDGAVGLVTGLGALIGRDPTTGRWSWDTAGTAWKGVGTLAVAALVYLTPGGRELDQTVGIPGFDRGHLGTTLLNAGKSIIAYDEWGKDPARAAGVATFNIVSAVVTTKGAGAALRTVGTAARDSRLAAVSSAGTVMVRSGEAIGKLPTVSELTSNAVRRIPGLRLPNLAEATRITVPHHTDIPLSGTRVELPTSHPHPGSVGDALSHTPHSGLPGHTEIPSQRVDAVTPAHINAHAHAPTEGHISEPSSGLHHDPAGSAPHTEHVFSGSVGLDPPPPHGTPGGHFEVPPPRTAADSPTHATTDLRPEYAGETEGKSPRLPPGHRVEYLDEAAREEFRLVVHEGKLYTSDGQLFDTSRGTSVWSGEDRRAIFVMDPYGNIYASNRHEVGQFHHSSFLAGGSVAGAGEIKVINGELKFISDRSGHHQPSPRFLEQVARRLKMEGVDLHGVFGS